MSLLPNLDDMTDNEKMAVLESIQQSIAQSKEIQKQKIAANVDLVVQALKKIESDIRDRFDTVGNSIEKRVASIKDGRDGSNGKDGRDGKDGKNGRDGAKGEKGESGQAGIDGVDGVDGVSVTNAHIDFDGSLIITLSTGVELNVGEVVAPDLAESIKVISNGGGTSQYVLDTLASLQTQINNLGNGLVYKGTWNASTNSPTLTSSSGTSGNYYVVSVSGSTNLNGVTDWVASDWAIYNGSVWQKIDQTNLVTSVAGKTGAVVLNNTDVSGFASIAAAGGTTVLTVSSAPNYVVTGSGGQTIQLPDATTLQNGAIFSFNNNQSSGTIIVKNNSSTTVATIQSGGYVSLVLLSNSLAAGSWDVHNYAPSNVSWSTNTFDYAGSITSATWNGNTVALNRGGTGQTTAQAAMNSFAGAVTSGSYLRGNGTNVIMNTIQAGDVPTLNQNTTGSAATLTTARAIYGNNFDGSAELTQIIASTYGGTGNGFTKFSGPATAEKTYTLPNSNATLLYDGGALGTPASGTVTNLTGTASININGTVGATTANTGSFTTATASTSVTTPIVTSAAATALTLKSAGTTAVTIDTSQNVGIGTASPTAGYKLDVQAAQALMNLQSTTGTNAVYQKFTNTGGDLYFGRDNSTGSAFSSGAYSTVLYSVGAYPVVFNINGTERMRIDSSGNVGIGTSTVQTRLDTVGAGLNLAGTAYGTSQSIQDTTTKRGVYLGYDTSGQIGIVAANTASAGSNLAFWTYSGSAWGERMRIDSSGNLLVGTTSASGKFTLKSSGATSGTSSIYITNSTPAYTLVVNDDVVAIGIGCG
jgi:hypothetical protein